MYRQGDSDMKMTSALVAAAGVSLGLLAAGPGTAADRERPAAPATVMTTAAASADVEVATAPNCLLPGQIRNFGSVTMLTPKRPVTLEPTDCLARGGEPFTAAPLTN
jgi:hypothetical protein